MVSYKNEMTDIWLIVCLGVRVPAGLLYYSQLDSILRVEAKPNEIRALIIARNELAHYLSKKRKLPGAVQDRPLADIELAAFLPPTIDHPRECSHCYAVDSCMLYRKVSQALCDLQRMLKCDSGR